MAHTIPMGSQSGSARPPPVFVVLLESFPEAVRFDAYDSITLLVEIRMARASTAMLYSLMSSARCSKYFPKCKKRRRRNFGERSKTPLERSRSTAGSVPARSCLEPRDFEAG